MFFRRSKSRDKAKERVERLKRERTILQENLRREKTFAERSETESMEQLADKLQTEANGKILSNFIISIKIYNIYKVPLRFKKSWKIWETPWYS